MQPRTRILTLLILSIGAAAVLPAPAAAQDQWLFSRAYGTPLPQGYWEALRREPGMFRFERALKAVGARARGVPLRAPGAGGAAGPSYGVTTAFSGPARGSFRLPVVLGLFQNSGTPAVRTGQLDTALFRGPNQYFQTLTEFYAELSNSLLTITGTVFDSARSSLTLAEVMGSTGCLAAPLDCRIGDYIHHVLEAVDARGVDWGQFDNDGPDGMPNSQDDDGYVDVLAVFHPVKGGECGGPGPHARMARLASMPGLQKEFLTRTPSNRPGFGNVRIDDFVIQSAVSCDPGRGVTEIGILAHEFGHALGLPDLYDTDGGSEGIGAWGLMGAGAWGCSSAFMPERPCHMEAWSKSMLGWVTVETLAADAEVGALSLPAVETSHQVLRVNSGDGSAEYFLLESRQRVGFDQSIPGEGLLVWHIDPTRAEFPVSFNRTNTDPSRYGVGLIEADGDFDLRKAVGAGGNLGDGFDPFPGASGNRFFHAGSSPASLSNAGWATGVTMQDIALNGGSGNGRSTFTLSTRFNTLSFRLNGSDSARVSIDGRRSCAESPAGATRNITLPADVRWARFESRCVTPAPGIAERNGVRFGFQDWGDAGSPAGPRTVALQLADSALSLRYAKEFRLETAVQGPLPDVSPGSVRLAPPGAAGGWFLPAASVSAQAEARTGFAFDRWQGAATGTENPVSVTMDTARALTALFAQAFATTGPTTIAVSAADSIEIVLQATNGNPPVQWQLSAGELPDGVAFDPVGKISGTPFETGDFALTLTARDSLGLTASKQLTLQVQAPVIAVSKLIAPLVGAADGPSTPQRRFLDRMGNGNGSYDVGDLRVFVLANPDLPLTAAERALVRIFVPVELQGSGARVQGSGILQEQKQ